MTANGWLVRVAAVGRSSPLAVALLVAANLIPLAGVLFFDWDVAAVLYTYWLENGVVGLLNVPKILMASGPNTGSIRGINGGKGGNAGVAAFFLVHYGLFWVVHGVFVVALTSGVFSGFDLTDPLRSVLADPGLLIAAAALFISHATSFWLNYVMRGEYRTVSVGSQMFAPYPRMFALHITIVFGGALVIGMRQPELVVALLVVVKTGIDLVLHLREHGKRALAAASPVITVSPAAGPPIV